MEAQNFLEDNLNSVTEHTDKVTLDVNEASTERYFDWCHGDAPELDEYKYCTYSGTHYIFHNDEGMRAEFSMMTATTLEDDDARFDFLNTKHYKR